MLKIISVPVEAAVEKAVRAKVIAAVIRNN